MLSSTGFYLLLSGSQDFLLTAHRDAEAAKGFLRKALKALHTQEPRVINVEQNPAYPKAIEQLKGKKELYSQVELRQNKYLFITLPTCFELPYETLSLL